MKCKQAEPRLLRHQGLWAENMFVPRESGDTQPSDDWFTQPSVASPFWCCAFAFLHATNRICFTGLRAKPDGKVTPLPTPQSHSLKKCARVPRRRFCPPQNRPHIMRLITRLCAAITEMRHKKNESWVRLIFSCGIDFRRESVQPTAIFFHQRVYKWDISSKRAKCQAVT